MDQSLGEFASRLGAIRDREHRPIKGIMRSFPRGDHENATLEGGIADRSGFGEPPDLDLARGERSIPTLMIR